LHNSFTADVHRLLKDIETFPVAWNVVTNWYTVTSLGTSLSGYALLSASQTAENYFDAK
jgi:hypothetical protein